MNLFTTVCPCLLQTTFFDVDIRIVGGAVRDFLIGASSQDIDLVVPLPPTEVIERLKKAHIDYLLMGIEFGTITALIDGKSFEITSLRQDVQHIGRHPKVSYTTCFKTDALRRDFTFNALYMDKHGQIFDPLEGALDLKKGIVRFIGDPHERIREDPLRILRFYRFFAKVGSQMDLSSRNAARELMNTTHSLSKERIWNELSQILSLPTRTEALTLLKEDGFYKGMHISASLDALETDTSLSPLTLVISLGLPLTLNWSRPEKLILKTLLSLRDDDHMPLFLALRYPKDLVQQLMYLRFLDAKCTHKELNFILKSLELYVVPEFPLKGQDLIKLGLTPGLHLGEILKHVRDHWERDPHKMTYEQCLMMAAQVVQSVK